LQHRASLQHLLLISLYNLLVVTSLESLATNMDTAFSTRFVFEPNQALSNTDYVQDINNSGDGGIYAELIQNRAFQYSRNYSVSTANYFPVNGAKLSIQELDEPLSKALPASMRVEAGNGTGKIGFKNEGYWGIDVKQQKYTGSFWVKGAYEGTFVASLESNLTSDVFGSVDVPSKSVADEWTEHTFELTPEKDAPNSNNTFSVTFDSSAADALDFNLISLFPPTYKGRKNGLRIDIAEALADMNPVCHNNFLAEIKH
jgi:alpha-N-arabinofuranosidase